MALNPPLVGGGVPMGIVGERFCLERSGMCLELEGGGLGRKVKANGTLFLTTVRLCFVPERPDAGFAGVDIPLQGISGETFKQPIFGANYVAGVVAPVAGRGLTAPATFRLYFYKGGCQTFLNAFFALMEKYKDADAAARRAWLASATATNAWVSGLTAYVDPSDPSTIFLVQPAAVASATMLPAASVPYGPPVAVAVPAGAAAGAVTVVGVPVAAPTAPPPYAPAAAGGGAGAPPAGAGYGYGYGYGYAAAAPPPPPAAVTGGAAYYGAPPPPGYTVMMEGRPVVGTATTTAHAMSAPVRGLF